MLLRDLTKVYISEYQESNNHGEKEQQWTPKADYSSVRGINTRTVSEIDTDEIQRFLETGIAFLNLQQDINELDRKSTGEVDYSIYKARTTIDYPIEKGNGISFSDISQVENFKPDYRVLDKNKIGDTYVYRLEKVQ